MPERSFRVWVGILALLRILPAIVVLAANGRSLPTIPGSRYGPPTGDTYGFYAAAREFVSAWAHVSRPLLALSVLALVAALVIARRLWRQGSGGPAVALLSVAIGLFTAVGVRAMVPTGAGAVGWPIVWSIPMFPLRAAGLLSYHVAYYVGIAILLAANVVTVIATALIARRFARPRIALLAPALLVLWPFLMRFVEGTGNIVYGSWLVDSGRRSLLRAAVDGARGGRARPDRPARRRRARDRRSRRVDRLRDRGPHLQHHHRRCARLERPAARAIGVPPSCTASPCAGLGAIAAAFWSLGYATFSGGKSEQAPAGLFSWHYLLRSWRDSGVFDWKMLLLLLPLPLVGAWALRRDTPTWSRSPGRWWSRPAFYSAYYITALHPRFLFVALPAALRARDCRGGDAQPEKRTRISTQTALKPSRQVIFLPSA